MNIEPGVRSAVGRILDRFLRLGQPTPVHQIKASLGPKRHAMEELVAKRVIRVVESSYLPCFVAIMELTDPDTRESCQRCTAAVLETLKRLYIHDGEKDFTSAEVLDIVRKIEPCVREEEISVGMLFATDFSGYFSGWSYTPSGIVASVRVREGILDFDGIETAWSRELEVRRATAENARAAEAKVTDIDRGSGVVLNSNMERCEKGMSNKQDDRLNKLLGRDGSIAERNRLAKELDEDSLQLAAPYSPEAKEELERRRHERLVASARDRLTEERQLEQKFRILDSPAQIQTDFDRWVSEAAEIADYSVGVIFLDIDDFKQFNTTFTESVVDSTLFPDFQQIVAQLCKQRGAAYRYGGEELLILLPNCLLDETAAFAEKVRGRIEANTFHVQEQTVKMTVSVGVAAWPLHGDTLKMVIERANQEEHAAKEQGKNRVSLAPVD